MIIVVTLQLVYQQVSQMLPPKPLNLHYMNIFLETDILLPIMQLVNKGREIIQTLRLGPEIIQKK